MPLHAPGETEPLFLVVFNEAAAPIEKERQQALEANERDAAIQGLERELSSTRQRLQAVIEEYETSLEELKSSNEELHSVNEEMQAANEELEASKEEPQSLNEELHTVNSELDVEDRGYRSNERRPVHAVRGHERRQRAPDAGLRIRMFTDAAAQIFGLQPSDVGRSLRNFSAPVPLIVVAGRDPDRDGGEPPL